MGATADKARKARERARTQNSNRGSTGSTDRLVMDLTRGKVSFAKKNLLTRFVNEPEQRAANIMQQRRALDTGKTAARATAIEKREAKKKAAKTLMTGVSGGIKKAASKPKTKPKTLNDFLKEGKRPPSKNKKIPSDADVIIKGYNDKKTLSKNKKK